LRPVTLGFIALTDCASLVMGEGARLLRDRGLDVTLQKQGVVARNARRVAHQPDRRCALPLRHAVLGGDGDRRSGREHVAEDRDGAQQQRAGITLKKDYAAAGYGSLAKARKVLEAKTPTMAMTFPGGTHDLWLRYWLRAAGVDKRR